MLRLTGLPLTRILPEPVVPQNTRVVAITHPGCHACEDAKLGLRNADFPILWISVSDTRINSLDPKHEKGFVTPTFLLLSSTRTIRDQITGRPATTGGRNALIANLKDTNDEP